MKQLLMRTTIRFDRLRGERGGAAMILLLAFMVLAVPLTTATVQFAGQLNLNARGYDNRLAGPDSARAGIEVALWHLRNDTEEELDEVLEHGLDVPVNNETVDVTLDEGVTTADVSQFAYADLVLTLDVSGSISYPDNYMPDLQEVAHTIVDRFDLHGTEGRIRIGITKFAGQSSSEGDSSASLVPMTDEDGPQTTPPEDHFDGFLLHEEINELDDARERICVFSWGGSCYSWTDSDFDVGYNTNIVAGIEGGAAQFGIGPEEEPEFEDRPEVPNLMVFITDGNDNSGNDSGEIRAASDDATAATGAEIFAVGVGNVSTATLEAIATNPDYGDSGQPTTCHSGETLGHVFYADDFEGLLELIDCIVYAVNQSGLVGTLYDIESVAPDGTTIQVHVLLTPDGDTIILSWQEY